MFVSTKIDGTDDELLLAAFGMLEAWRTATEDCKARGQSQSHSTIPMA
jgi:hypothetical protein